MNRNFASAVTAIAIALLFSFTAAPVFSDDAAAIDWNRARQLLDRRNSGQTLTPEEQIYLQRAIQARGGTAGEIGVRHQIMTLTPISLFRGPKPH